MRGFLFVALAIAIAIMSIFGPRSAMSWVTSGFYAIVAAFLISRNRNAEPMRTLLIDVLSDAAGKRNTDPNGSAAMMSTNGP